MLVRRLATWAVAVLLGTVTATATVAGAQTQAQATVQLGEGDPQPGARPYPVAHTAARPRTTATPWSVRMTRSVMQRNPVNHRRWDYTGGVVLGAIEQVGLSTRDTAMLAYVERGLGRFITPEGTIAGYEREEYNIDHVAPGRVLFGLLQRTGDPRYRRALDLLRSQLATHPRTSEGGFWHKRIYPNQMWLDGLYMGAPFYAQYARTFDEPAAFDDVAKQFLLVARHTRDAKTGLMYHGWDESRTQFWADTATGLSANFWGRAMGWYMLGVVEALDHLPPDHPDRDAIIQTFAQAADAVARVQDPLTGLWWDVLDQPNRSGNYLEASASSMFAYAFAKGARLGYLDARYRAVGARAFEGLVTHLVRENADGSISLVNIVQVSGLGGNPRRDGSLRDGSYAYYVSEPVVTDDYKGVGPFILAALELGR